MTIRSHVCPSFVHVRQGGRIVNDRVYVSRRAQVPVLHPSGTGDAHYRASLHTLVCATRRCGAEEEEASDVDVWGRCKSRWNGWVTRRGRRLLLRYLLALCMPLSVWPKGTPRPVLSNPPSLETGNLSDFLFFKSHHSPPSDNAWTKLFLITCTKFILLRCADTRYTSCISHSFSLMLVSQSSALLHFH